jgi:hypothetical protein
MTAQIRVGGGAGSLVELKGEDELWAKAGTLERQFSGGDGTYLVAFDDDGDGTELVVSLKRGDMDEDAPDSRIRLPKNFEPSFKEISRGDNLARGNSLTLRWTPAGSGVMSYNISGDCIVPIQLRTSDDGEVVISANQIAVFQRDRGESCDVTIQMGRESSGSIDPGFREGGSFRGHQGRRINFTSTPGADELATSEPDNQGGAQNGDSDGPLGGAD